VEGAVAEDTAMAVEEDTVTAAEEDTVTAVEEDTMAEVALDESWGAGGHQAEGGRQKAGYIATAAGQI
jgi:hypothetical protein